MLTLTSPDVQNSWQSINYMFRALIRCPGSKKMKNSVSFQHRLSLLPKLHSQTLWNRSCSLWTLSISQWRPLTIATCETGTSRLSDKGVRQARQWTCMRRQQASDRVGPHDRWGSAALGCCFWWDSRLSQTLPRFLSNPLWGRWSRSDFQTAGKVHLIHGRGAVAPSREKCIGCRC